MNDYKYERKVCYYETDQMGIVHHSNYIRWMEEARLDMMDKLSLSYARMESEGLLSPVLSVSCEYKLPFRYGDSFQIELRPLLFNGVKLKIGYRMVDADGKLHALGETGHCFVDASMRPVSLKKSNPAAYDIFQKWAMTYQEETL